MKHKIMAAVMGLGLMAQAHAADTSSTINVRKSITPVGVSPQIGTVKATATATGSFTFDLPVPKTSSGIIEFVGVAYNPSGTAKPLQITRSGKTVTVTNSDMVSGTLAIGDFVRGIVIYNP
ncbi:hypothetical protein CSIRO_3066 [Bradyrhizobiaceae bacterium SG-6C]|nr:hypothetical protein CSIRO_3066 [Bradyrhizobiaceae bacterium SG-6C]